MLYYFILQSDIYYLAIVWIKASVIIKPWCCPHLTFLVLISSTSRRCLFVPLQAPRLPDLPQASLLVQHDAVSCTLWASRCLCQHAKCPSSPPLIKNPRQSDITCPARERASRNRMRTTYCASACAVRKASCPQPPYSAPAPVYTTPHPARTISRGRLRFAARRGHHHRLRGRSGSATMRPYWSRWKSWHLIRWPRTCSLSHASASSECACAGFPKCERCRGGRGVFRGGREERERDKGLAYLGSVDTHHADVDRVSH